MDMTVPVRRTSDLPLSGHGRYVSVRHLGVPPGVGSVAVRTPADGPGGTVKKSDREIMEILEAFDATGGAFSGAAVQGRSEDGAPLCAGQGPGQAGGGAG